MYDAQLFGVSYTCLLYTSNEYGVYGSGVTDLANACPEFDVIVGGHGHRSIPNMMINNVLVVENKNAGATLSEIHVYLCLLYTSRCV